MTGGLDARAYEEAYDRLAAALDRVGPRGEADFLARLCLLLIDHMPDSAAVAEAIAAAERAAGGAGPAVRPGDG